MNTKERIAETEKVIRNFIMFEYTDDEHNTYPVHFQDFLRDKPDFFNALASSISTTLKPSWTSEELDNLGKAIDTIRGDKNLNHWSLQQHAETLKALDLVLNFCKQALLGR